MSCTRHDGCVGHSKKVLSYPIDPQSLYGDRTYDKQTANRRCYEKRPINIIEGFGRRRINRIIKWVIIIIILYILFTMIMQFMQPTEVFAMDISPTSQGFTGDTMRRFILHM